MPVMEETQLILDHKFDPQTCRHMVNGEPMVMHCHHFITLYTRLAEDCGMLDGKKLMAEVAEDTFQEMLSKYYQEHEVTDVTDRITIAEQYYSALGLGQMKVLCAGTDGGEVELTHSHVDEGWLKKWGKHENSVNYITSGYIAGLFSAVFGQPKRHFNAVETQSIVCGARSSRFQVVAN
ncbi:MAG: hypothetical protein ACUVXJ_18845 [Phycisphaerae bacterium]